MMIKKLPILILVLFTFSNLFAQDPIFTQFYASPILINPGFAGSTGNTRLALGYRDQWNGSSSNLSTFFASADQWIESINSGIGLSIIDQDEELTNYSFTQINFSYAYHIRLSEKLTFLPGISYGYGLKQFNFDNLILGDQIDIFNGSVSGISSDPIFENTKIIFFDISIGGLLYTEKAWFGYSLRHLTEPDISFLEDEDLLLSMHFSVHGGYKFLLNSKYQEEKNISYLFLTFNYMNQDNYNRFDFGAEFEVSSIYFGLLTSTVTNTILDESETLLSINPLVGVEFKNFKLGFSYDIPTSKIGNIANTSELTLKYNFSNNNSSSRRALCPSLN